MCKKEKVLDVVKVWASVNNVSFEALVEDLGIVLERLGEDVYWLPCTLATIEPIVDAWEELFINDDDSGFDEYFVGTNDYYVRSNSKVVSYWSESAEVGFFVFKK